MAQVFGEAGGFVTRRSRQGFLRLFALLMVAGYALMLAAGHLLGTGGRAGWLPMVGAVALAVVILKRVDALGYRSLAYRAGAVGERRVADILDSLPNSFRVFHDCSFPPLRGNIDHLVIGPTGVFALDTKNWKGTVHTDQTGQGRSGIPETLEKEANRLVANAVSIRDLIAPILDRQVYVQAVLVFPSAKLLHGRTQSTSYDPAA